MGFLVLWLVAALESAEVCGDTFQTFRRFADELAVAAEFYTTHCGMGGVRAVFRIERM